MDVVAQHTAVLELLLREVVQPNVLGRVFVPTWRTHLEMGRLTFDRGTASHATAQLRSAVNQLLSCLLLWHDELESAFRCRVEPVGIVVPLVKEIYHSAA